MRANVKKALEAWKKEKPCRASESIWTDGETIFSYNTALVTRNHTGKVILNETNYSKTTTTQQGALRFALRGENLVTVMGITQNAKAVDLCCAAIL